MRLAYLLYSLAFWAALPIIAAWALIVGDRWVRIVASAQVSAATFTLAAFATSRALFGHFELALALIDTSLLAVFIYVAAYANRGWMLWAAGFQTIAVISHIVKLLSADYRRLAYAIMEGFSSYPTLILLAVGTLQHVRAKKRDNVKPSPARSKQEDAAIKVWRWPCTRNLEH